MGRHKIIVVSIERESHALCGKNSENREKKLSNDKRVIRTTHENGRNSGLSSVLIPNPGFITTTKFRQAQKGLRVLYGPPMKKKIPVIWTTHEIG